MARLIMTFLLMLILFSCEEDNSLAIKKISDYELVFREMIVKNNFHLDLELTGAHERLAFYISDSQCSDCILSQLKLLAEKIKSGALLQKEIIILSEYSDEHLLQSQLIRSGLKKTESINVLADDIFDGLNNVYDLPTFFIYSPDLQLGHSFFQADLVNERLSTEFLNGVIYGLKKND